MYDRLVAALRLEGRAAQQKELQRIEGDVKVMKARATEAEWLKALRQGKAPEKVSGLALAQVMVPLLMPAAARVQNAADRSEQVHRNLMVAFALAGYHSDNGNYPKALEALVPRYLKTVPDDLFSGKALIYRTTDKGYLLYSVGANGKDDGGRWTDDDPPGDDPRVRMPPVRKE